MYWGKNSLTFEETKPNKNKNEKNLSFSPKSFENKITVQLDFGDKGGGVKKKAEKFSKARRRGDVKYYDGSDFWGEAKGVVGGWGTMTFEKCQVKNDYFLVS